MRAHVIQNGVVVNTIEVNSLDVIPGLVDARLGGVIGDSWDGKFFSPAPAPPVSEAEYTAAIQAMLDGVARTRNYDGILSAASYATSGNPKFRAEGQACVDLRDAVWAKSYAVMADVKAGRVPAPSVQELLAAMPSINWPN